MKMGSCSEKIDLSSVGIEHNCCIDKEIIEKLLQCSRTLGKVKSLKDGQITLSSFMET